MYRYVFWIFSLLMVILFNACNQSGNNPSKEVFNTDPEVSSHSANAFEVIYSLSLPTDIAGLFEEAGTGFNPDILIPLDRIPLYENPGQMSLIMGALGVDLSYCKLFERRLESSETYKYIELLAGKLGLPGDIFEKSATDLEQYINKPDSLTNLINQVYSDVDRYYKENDQNSLASLSLFGGWLEAMYISIKIYQDQSILEMGDRILQQKYGLNSLTGVLANHQESLLVRRYMHSLLKLKKAYEQVEIKYSQDGFKVNQQEQTIHASVAEIIYEPVILENICQIILQLRKEIFQKHHE